MSTPHSEEGGHLPPPPPPQQQLAESGESGSEAAVREAERWIEAVTGRSFVDKDFRGSLDNGILLCELLNSIKPGLVKKINRLLTPVAGLDNLALFLRGCEELGLKGSQLFDTGDLQDTRNNKGSDSSRKLKNVLITIYWLGRAANSSATYNGPTLDLREFEGLLLQMRKEAEDWDSPKHSIRDSGYIDCWESERSESLSPPRHARDDSFDSLDSIGSRSRHTPSPDGLLARASSDGRGSDSECDFPHRKLPDMRRDDMLARRTSCSEPRTAVPFNQYLPNKSNQTCYVPPQLRRQRTERDENRRSCSNATSPVGGERPFRSMSMIDMRSEEESLLSPHSQVRHELMHGQYNRMKEDESHWQDDLARWKSRRRSVSQDLIKKEEERKMMERLLNKEEGTQRRKSIKTYREIVEDKERRERELHEAYLKAKTPEEAAAVLDRYAQRFTISEAVLERLKLPKLLERSVSADPTGLSTSPTTPDPFTSSSSPFQYLRQQSLPAPKFTSTIEARVTGYRADLEDRSGGSRASRLERSAPLLAPKPFRHSRASSAEARSAKWDETERVNGELNNHRDIKREESSPLRFYPSPSLDADSDITDSSVSESQPADRYTTSHTPTHTPEPGREDSECVEKADSQCGGRSNMACVERASDSLVSADSDGVDRPQSECREREVSECVQRTDSESVEGAQSECLQRVDSECVERSYAECVVGSVCEAAGHGGLLPETQSQEEEETQEDQPPSRPTSLPMLPAEEEEVLQAKEEEPTTEPLPESEQSPEKKIKGSSDSTNSQNSTVKTGGQEAQAPSQSDTAAKEVSKPLQESPQRTAYPPEPAIKDKSKPSPVCGSSAIELDNSAQLTPLSSNPKLRWDFFTSSEPAEKQHSNVLNLVRRGEQFSWDPEEERKRQERWQQDQERMLQQEKYSREQEKLKQEWERAQKEVEEEERRYHEEERKILEETVAPLTPRSPMPYSSSPCWQEPAALVHSSSTQHSIVHSLADWEGKQDELDKQKWTLDNKRQRENGRSESTGIKEELSHMAGSPLRTSSDQLVGQSNGQREGTEEQNSWGSNTQQKQHSSESWKKSAPVDRSRNTQPGERRRSDSIENPSSHTDTQPPPSPNRSVSGKKLCSSCGLPLGKGAAMIIETLSLYFHIQCFKCGICKGQLGDTSTGTDVRIRNGLLNCHQCYLRSRSAGQPTTL
ncbi:LIM and calponin homology domains-containing protein 1 isoform X3 [Hoplias malabaricus]|uniref:LIM and calponin homology domains-containing protein 1 isoform X3 n=1 Tax=Hoplias malabaricus TaxID=27720 RepID=UPI0034636D3B